MGIYIFNRHLIEKLLDNPLSDFGKHIIPHAIKSHDLRAFIFQGYWEDIGTIRSFFEANLDLVSELPRFNFFDMNAPIYSRPRFLPGSKINGAEIDHVVISDGCIVNHARIRNSIIGLRTVIGNGTELNRVVTMGSDFYETDESVKQHHREGLPHLGIGEHCKIENAIIDKNARIGNNVQISPAGKPESVDHELYYVRDGIIIIPKNAVIRHGMVI
jgi:glucose-1-phosphate adenylyltransferase